jgi:hypothetical protein
MRFRVVDVLRLAFLALLIANLGRIPVVSAETRDAPIFLNDVAVGLLLIAGLVAAMQRRRFDLDATAALAILFAAVGGISALVAIPRFGLSVFQFLFSVAYLARWLVYFGIYLVVINYVRRADIPAVWSTIEKTILAFSAFGIVQAIFLPRFAQLVYPDSSVIIDWDDQGHRLVSTFLDPNFAGAFIALALLILLARLAYGARVARWKLAVLLAALAMTVSRSSFLALIAGATVILLVRGLSRRLLRVGGLLLLLALPFLPLAISFGQRFNKFSIDASAMTRVVNWLRALRVLADNLVIGVGFNTYGFVQQTYGYEMGAKASFSLDGGVLFIAVMTGLVGVSVYGAMVWTIMRRCRKTWRDEGRNAEDRGLALGIGAVTVAMLVHSVFINSLLFPFLMEPIWVLWGLSYVLGRVDAGLLDSPVGRRLSSTA